MRRTVLKAAVAAACMAAGLAAGQGKPIRMIVGFPPGQAADVVARVLADALGAELGTTVVVANMPGQGGSLALASLIASPPDGSVITLSALS